MCRRSSLVLRVKAPAPMVVQTRYIFRSSAASSFKEEGLQLVDELCLQVGLAHDLRGRQTQKFEHVGGAYVERGLRLGVFTDQFRKLPFVEEQARAFEIEAADLAFQLAEGPVAPDTLHFVEGPLGVFLDGNQFGQMAEGEPGGQGRTMGGWFTRRAPGNSGGNASRIWG
jgi:hypothetical protein